MVKVHFRLERDADGFPPADVESLWAQPIDAHHCRLDNVPFFAREVANRDVVEVKEEGGNLWFVRVAEEGGHGTIRVITYDKGDVDEIRRTIRGFGCAVELSHIDGYLSVDVRPESQKQNLLDFLQREHAADRLDYDEGCKNW
ncbi:MAG TPA: DUF4265 domain-containing protein [Polyangiaceae bacterium]